MAANISSMMMGSVGKINPAPMPKSCTPMDMGTRNAVSMINLSALKSNKSPMAKTAGNKKGRRV